MIEPEKIEDSVPATNHEVHRILGITHYDDPAQAARRMATAGQVPHLRVGRRIRFNLPALKDWAAQKLTKSVAASAGAA